MKRVTPETSHDIDMELGPSKTKLGKKNMVKSKRIDGGRPCPANCDVNVFFSELLLICSYPEAGFPGAWSIKLTFSLTITFYLTKN